LFGRLGLLAECIGNTKLCDRLQAAWEPKGRREWNSFS
jgi:hypothetical protein